MKYYDVILIILSITATLVGIFSIIWGIFQKKRSDRTVNAIRRENEAINYYLKTEIPNDLKERYINNINNFKYTNFDYENDNFERMFYELRKIRTDIKKANELRVNEIQELAKNNENNNEFDYAQLVYQISQMTNIQFLFDLLNNSKNQELKYVKNVLADIVHTIRNPASGMKAIIAILKMENINEEFTEKINDIEKYINEIETNLNAYYQISRMDPPVLDNNKVDLKNEIISRTRLLALSSGKKINIDSDDVCEVSIDKNVCEILMLAITCILENSMSFVNDNGFIIISVHNDNAILNIDITNNGPLIQEEYINKIFDQGYSSRGSSGRGLAIAKQAVENTLNGIISCENLDNGVKFSIVMETSDKNE